MNIDYHLTLTAFANWAAILTAAIATIAYGKYLLERRSKTKKLSNYLKNEKLDDYGSGKRTTLHLMAALGMTEAEIFAAAFRTERVDTAVSVDDKGRANLLLFEYCGDDIPVPKKF